MFLSAERPARLRLTSATPSPKRLTMADKQPPLRLITPQRSMRVELTRCFENPALDRIDLMVSFIMQSGIDLFKEEIDKALADGKHLRVLTTDYLAITDDAALGFLLDREGFHPGGGTLETKIFNAGSTSFHPKAYLFSSSRSDMARGFVGSSNLSRSGIVGGVEWNIELDDLSETLTEFKKLWTGPHSKSLTAQWLGHYAQRREAAHQKEKKTTRKSRPLLKKNKTRRPLGRCRSKLLRHLFQPGGKGTKQASWLWPPGSGKPGWRPSTPLDPSFTACSLWLTVKKYSPKLVTLFVASGQIAN